LIAKDIPVAVAATLVWVVKLAVLGVLLYVAFWIALLLIFAIAGAWAARNTEWEEPEPEWRNGHAGFGLYTQDEYHRIDPHDPLIKNAELRGVYRQSGVAVTLMPIRIRKRLLLLGLALLVGCDDGSKPESWGEPFLRGVNVRSGDYYLVVSDEYSGSDGLLFDDPEVLHQYKNGIRVKTSQAKSFLFGEGGGGQLSLWRKGKDDEYPVRRNHRTENWRIPQAMRAHGKVIARKEQFSNEDDFLQRLFALNAIDGVGTRFFHRSERRIFRYRNGMEYQELKNKKPCAWTPPDAQGHYHLACARSFVLYAPAAKAMASDAPQHVVSILLPAVITPVNQSYPSRKILDDIRQRLVTELARAGIDSYYAVGQAYDFVQGFYASKNYPSGIVLHEWYRLPERFLLFPDYNAHAFGLRIFCAAPCQEKIQAMQIQRWVDSPVAHETFLTDLRAFLHGHNKTLEFLHTHDKALPAGWALALSAGDYRASSVFDNTMEHELKSDVSAVYWREGWLRYAPLPQAAPEDPPETWHINWGYEIDRALGEAPYPAALLGEK